MRLFKLCIQLAIVVLITGIIARPSAPIVAAVLPSPTPTQSTPASTAQPTRIIPVTALSTTLIFTGDINPGRCIARDTLVARDFSYPFHNVADGLRNADIAIGSLDGSLSDRSDPMPCPDSMNLIGPTGMGEGFQFAGYDAMTIATNHIMDCGALGFDCDRRAFLDTEQTLLANGIQPLGAGMNISEARKPVIIERNGIRFAFLAVNEISEHTWATEKVAGVAPLSSESIEDIKADIASARAVADVVIVMPHWGIEYSPKPTSQQRAWAREMIEAGATLVIGNHPHVVQPIERFPTGVVFYSLGNFVFDQGNRPRRESVAVELVFIGSKLESWTLRPVLINHFTFQPFWATGQDAITILNRAPVINSEIAKP